MTIYCLVNNDGPNATIKPFYDFEHGPEITITPEIDNEWITLRYKQLGFGFAPDAEEFILYFRKSEVSVLELYENTAGTGSHAFICVGRDSLFCTRDQFDSIKQSMLDYIAENNDAYVQFWKFRDDSRSPLPRTNNSVH